MPFNLFVYRTDGRSFKTLRSPYDTRQDTAQTVRVILAGQPDAHDFADRVADAALGEAVVHVGTGVIFRTEES